MKLSRRCFLSFVVGGAAGTALSPLPWKLMDDVSIWSQNWPWTPVPADGAASYVNSTCTLCPGGCGISVRKIDERVVKIEGLAGHPVNDGGICLLGLSGLQLLYGPTRVTGPLKRVGKRGQGQWKAISWKAAIEEVAAKLTDIRSQGRPQSVACIAPKDIGSVPQLLNRLLTAYGSPNFYRMPSLDDAYEAALYLTQGADGFAGLDVEHADFILSFGSGILDGYGSPVRMFRAHSQLKDRHGKLIQIEARLSNTAAQADRWLPIQPGSEADLALAMAHAIIEQNLFNAEFIGNNCEGFDAFAQMVKEKYTPQKVSAAVGLDADTIVETAKAFASAKKPLALYGSGKGRARGSLKEALAVHALNALVGNINRQGGVQAMPAYAYLNWPDTETDSVAAAGLQAPRMDGAGGKDSPHTRYLVNRMIQAVNNSPDNLQVLLVAESNPLYTLPDTETVQAAFDKIPLVVSFSSFLDETAMQADLILPNHHYLERYEDIPVTAGVTPSVVGLCQPVVEPLLNTQHLGDTIIQIGKAIGGTVAKAFPWDDYEGCLQQALGGQWDTLADSGVLTMEQSLPQGGANGFGTPSGKFELMNDALGAIFMAENAVPEGDSNVFPLQLMAYDSIRLNSTYIGDPPFMIKTLSDKVLKGQEGIVHINPQTAAEVGMSDGQAMSLITPKGEAFVRVHFDDGVMPGVVAMPRGLGHTAYDRYLAGKGVNVNQLIGPVEDPASGLDAAWGIRAKLTKA